MSIKINQIFICLLWGVGLSLALGQLVRIQLTESLAIYPHDMFIGLFTFLWGIRLLIKRRQPYTDSVINSLVVLSLWLGVTLLINSTRFGSTFGILYYLRWLLLMSLYPTVKDLSQEGVVFKLPQLLTFVSLVQLVLGLGQYSFFPDSRFLYSFGWDDHLNRLIGAYFDPGFTGLLLLLSFIWIAYRKKLSWLGPVYITAILLTYSRASILALVMVLFMSLAIKTSFKRSLGYLVLLPLLFFMLPRQSGEGVNLSRTYSVESRIDSSVSSLEVFAQNPLIGIGFNNYRNLLPTSQTEKPSHTSAPDNSYVFLLATSGVVGLGLFIYFLLCVWRKDDRSGEIVKLSILAISAHSFFNNSWFYAFILIWLGLVFVAVEDPSLVGEVDRN